MNTDERRCYDLLYAQRILPPQGYGHYVEQIGDQPTEILILFNSPEYREIGLATWLGGNPSSLLAANFGIPQDAIDQLPKKERGILGKS
jgi:oxalate decarboxylase